MTEETRGFSSMTVLDEESPHRVRARSQTLRSRGVRNNQPSPRLKSAASRLRSEPTIHSPAAEARTPIIKTRVTASESETKMSGVRTVKDAIN